MAQLIEDYGLIGDLHTAALVGRDGSVDWMCLPRFDSPACFASLLGNEDAGFWRVAPTGGGLATRRRYLPDTLVLESEWDTPEGTVRVTDAMPPRGDAADVVRVVEGVRGRVPMTMALRLRFDYGRVVPWVQQLGGDLAAMAGPDAAWLRTPARLEGRNLTTYAEFTVAAGERVPFVLTYKPSHERRPEPVDPERALDETVRFWREWVGQVRYEGGWRDAVVRSLLTVKALTYAPTGGIAAAATTSLPEQLGGPRNWDYRFCWLRDATFVLQALLGTGFVAEAKAWREWLLRAVAGDPADLQIMYGLDGARRLPELTLDWLGGYEESRPVRIGNAAAGQLQLDVWGEVLDSLHLARDAGIESVESAWELQRALLDFLEGHWDTPDNGLWEMRGPRRHFVHSKVLAWAGLDRAVRAVQDHGLAGPVDRWRALRHDIHADICARGYDAERGTFTQYYGADVVDASLLLIPQTGFLPWDDPRVVGTVRAVEQDLFKDGFVLRYDPGADGSVDGLPGDEGAFVACTFWFADALHGIGRRRDAREVFQRLLDLRSDLGLLSEEYDTRAGRQVGNTPQAYSHVGLINTARHLSQAHPATRPRGGTRGR
ncbi:glycoside hydrolase family 15 protein [Cellulomonas septica]|uniref:Glycoside hydrolase family 15 protein n=1 Tax=Cellulomonas septica TaxID=285080 RepID=A0ABX1JW45_9CELL|nr:glycoside hydrolase family 15 protein [Cellulomonas septica]NKY38056.1 glycoside hydrolase family 15 protein [Cellulomonas septica]